MTEHAGPEDTPPTERTKRNMQAGRPMAAAGTHAKPTVPQPRDVGSWAAKVDRLTVTRGGSRGANVVAPAPYRSDPGLRENVAEDLPHGGRHRHLTEERYRHVEGALCRILAGRAADSKVR